MANDIEVQVKANVAELKAGMQQAVQSVQSAATGIQSELGKIQGIASSVGSVFGALGALLAGGAMFKACANETIKWNSEAMKLSRTLGITTEQASVLNVALGDIYSSSEEYTHAAQMMTRQLNSGGEGFKKLGINVRDAKGDLRTTGDIMTDVLDKLNSLKAGTDRNAAGMAVFGRSWGEASKLLKLNAEVMQDAKEKAERLHLIVGPEGVAMTKAYKASMNDVEDVMTSLKVQVGSAVLPALTKLGTFMGDIGPGLAKTLEYTIKGLVQVFLYLKLVVEMLTINLTALIATMIEGWKTVGSVISNIATGNLSGAVQAAKAGAQAIKNEWLAAFDGIGQSRDKFMKDSKDLWADKAPASKKTGEEPDGKFNPEKNTKQVSPFEAYSKEWEKQKALLISQGAEADEYGRKAEEGFWRGKLTVLAQGGEDWIKATLKVHELAKQQESEDQEKRKAQLADDLAAAKDNSSKRLALAQAYYDEIKGKHKEGEKITLDAHKRLEEEQHRHAAKMREIAELQSDGILAARLADLASEEQTLKLWADLGEISGEEEIRQMIDLENRKANLKRERLNQKAVDATDPARQQEIYNELEAMEAEHQARLNQLRGDAMVIQQRQLNTFLQPLTQSYNQVLNGLLEGTMNWSQGVKGVWDGLCASIRQSIAGMATDWLSMQTRQLAMFVMNKAKELVIHRATETQKTASTSTGVVTRIALETWAAVKSVALAVWAGLKHIAINAYKAFAGVYQSVASIPYVGWIMAPVMAGAALAAVLGMASKLTSAAGGYDIPAGVNPLVQAHAKEMILPAKYADVIRGLANGSESAQAPAFAPVFNIQTLDAHSFAQYLSKNQGVLASVLAEMHRNGRL